MKWLACSLGLLALAGLGSPALAADCFIGTWEADTPATHEHLEIKKDGCLNLTVTSKATDSEETLYETCYKLKGQEGGTYVLEIEHNGNFSAAEVSCVDKTTVRLHWGEITSTTYLRAKP